MDRVVEAKCPDAESVRASKAVKTEPADQVEAALWELFSEELLELTKQRKGGPKCWPAIFLGTAGRSAAGPLAAESVGLSDCACS